MKVERSLKLTDSEGASVTLTAEQAELTLSAINRETEPTLEGFHHDAWYFRSEDLLVEVHHTSKLVLMTNDWGATAVVREPEVDTFRDELRKFISWA